MYEPATGRFTTLDPFFGTRDDPQSFHKYGYVHGDPVNNVDPTGEFASLGGALAGISVSLGIGGIGSPASHSTISATSGLFASQLLHALNVITNAGLSAGIWIDIGPLLLTQTDTQLKEYEKYFELWQRGGRAGTPKRPFGDGLHIAIWGERDNPEFTDYAAEPKYREMKIFPGVMRPLTTTLPDNSVSHFSIRSSPADGVTAKEVNRLAMPGAILSITTSRKSVHDLLKQMKDNNIYPNYQFYHLQESKAAIRGEGGQYFGVGDAVTLTIVFEIDQ